MVGAFPRLSQHIRQLEWIHLDDSTISLDSADLSRLNVQSLLLSSWSVELDEPTLARFVRSSASRLSALQLHNMARIRGDLLRVATSVPNLQHLYLTMADTDGSRHHPRQRTHPSPAMTSSAELAAASPSSSPLAVLDRVTPASELAVTCADSLPALLDACPQLRTIELRGLPAPAHCTTAVADPGSELADGALRPTALPLVTMKQLTIINLHASAVTGSTLSTLFTRCPQLVKLDLGQTSPLYLSGLHLDPHLSMSALSTLLLSDCHFIDGHGFKEIFKASPSLLVLEIPKTNIDDSALAVLGHHCEHLMDLNLDGCLHITDQGVRDMLSHRPRTSKDMHHQQIIGADATLQGPYQNHNLQCLTVSNCTELTGQGIHHILMTCAGLRNLEIQQPEIMPESLFPHTLETDEDDEQPSPTTPATLTEHTSMPEEDETTSLMASVYPLATAETVETAGTDDDGDDVVSNSPPWACSSTLETLRIKNLNVINQEQTRFLNARLRELSQLKVLHIGGSQLELSVLNGLGHQLENLYIDDLAREVDLEDVRWLVDHTPNLTRLWCRQLIRYSEPWKLLRGARKHLKLW
ncbi:hypothetical protein BGZ72_007036 [Mortierella alpina]|nr:hypothetical protein BGZ72_007036 [Mortierella alpina]